MIPNKNSRLRVFLRVAAAVAAVAAASLAGLSRSASSASGKPTVTFVSDSVAASLSYVSSARATLGHGLTIRYDLKVCRRLVAPSCSFQGTAPTTALQAVQSYGHALGEVLIVDVGYNDSDHGYAQGIDQIMRTALAQGATAVVWVTLREAGTYSGVYHWTNIAIKTAPKRWPQLIVADWNAYSAGRPWFGTDDPHLSSLGAAKLAAFLRPFVTRALELRHP